jgi:hypothetical protein
MRAQNSQIAAVFRAAGAFIRLSSPILFVHTLE